MAQSVSDLSNEINNYINEIKDLMSYGRPVYACLAYKAGCE